MISALSGMTAGGGRFFLRPRLPPTGGGRELALIEISLRLRLSLMRRSLGRVRSAGGVGVRADRSVDVFEYVVGAHERGRPPLSPRLSAGPILLRPTGALYDGVGENIVGAQVRALPLLPPGFGMMGVLLPPDATGAAAIVTTADPGAAVASGRPAGPSTIPPAFVAVIVVPGQIHQAPRQRLRGPLLLLLMRNVPTLRR
mmetsp:Transcript_10956/g.32429  ORF Transcript_10956/g.32429 Transcript_10956/m.32429 type:complete len:200 (+) Transcript_10956:1626-2225(+)